MTSISSASCAPELSAASGRGPLVEAGEALVQRFAAAALNVAWWPPQRYATVLEVMKRWMASLALS